MRTVQCLNNGLPASPDLPECSKGCQPALKPQVSAKLSPTAEQAILPEWLIYVGQQKRCVAQPQAAGEGPTEALHVMSVQAVWTYALSSVMRQCALQVEQSCVVGACISYLWQTGSWSACANGQSTRTVHCMDSHGANTTDEVDILTQSTSLQRLMPCSSVHGSRQAAYHSCQASRHRDNAWSEGLSVLAVLHERPGPGAPNSAAVWQPRLCQGQRLHGWWRLQCHHICLRMHSRLCRTAMRHLAGPLQHHRRPQPHQQRRSSRPTLLWHWRCGQAG